MRRFVCSCLIVLLSGVLSGQQPEAAPRFEIADVHVSGVTGRNPFRGVSAHGGRFEMKAATMIDLIRTAWGYSNDRILEGPNWLEMDRFDVIAKEPASANEEARRLMLQSLLSERFSLVVRKEDRPLPGYALVAGKKSLLKPADGTGAAGCKPKLEGGVMAGPDGLVMAVPGSMIEFNCRNIGMADFAAGLRGMFTSGDPGRNPVIDETGLKGAWNFDVRWSAGSPGATGQGSDRITTADAIEKQLGLKLELRQIPAPVIVVKSVDRKPSANPKGVAEGLTPVKTDQEFEVADVKPSAPGGSNSGLRNQPGGRVTAQSIPMTRLLARAFDTAGDEELIGIPDWARGARFDIAAKAPAEAGRQSALDRDTLSAMLRAMLADRFKMTWHTEERPATTYALIAVKPRMKKADPKVRAGCRYEDPASEIETLRCQDVTMGQFADQLHGIVPELHWPVTDETALEGAWDLTLKFSRFPPTALARLGRGGDAEPQENPIPAASEPGGGYTIFEAVEKQLGLKLAARKRNMPAIVIDHLEQKPAEN